MRYYSLVSKKYMFKALLCHFVLGAKAGDVSGVADAVTKYKNMSAAFDGTRECKLIESLDAAYAASDVQKFTDHLFAYDRISKLDNWTSTLLLSVKSALKASTESTSASAVSFSGTASTLGMEPDLQSGGAVKPVSAAVPKAIGATPTSSLARPAAPMKKPPADEPDMM